MTIVPNTASLTVGQAVQFSTNVNGAKWSSSNPAIASVTSTGSVTAKAAGTVTIRAQKGPQKATATVSVTAAQPQPAPTPVPTPPPTPDPVPVPPPPSTEVTSGTDALGHQWAIGAGGWTLRDGTYAVPGGAGQPGANGTGFAFPDGVAHVHDSQDGLWYRWNESAQNWVLASTTPTPVPEPQPVPQPTPTPIPTPTPTPTPTPVPPPSGSRQLIGGWRFPFDYQRGAIAIDFARMKLWMVGHSQRQEILEFDLPGMGTGPESSWPVVHQTRIIDRFWGTGNAYGLAFFRGKLWVSPRVFYDQPPQSEEPLTLFGSDGSATIETIDLPYKRQTFSGFVKRGPGQDPLIGGGGYDSGQGTKSGPSLATLAGQKLIEYGWPGDPGPNLEHWNERAPRDTNYTPLRRDTEIPEDSWVGWLPRHGEGRWASDRIYGGGLVLPEGITYFALMGTGGLDYGRQSLTFADYALDRTYEYLYTPSGQFVSYAARPDLGLITGQEIDAAGRVYLLDLGVGWFQAGAGCTLKVFG